MSAALAIRAIQPSHGHNGGPALDDHMIAHRRGRVIVIDETARRPVRLARRTEFATLARKAEQSPTRTAVHGASVADHTQGC